MNKFIFLLAFICFSNLWGQTWHTDFDRELERLMRESGFIHLQALKTPFLTAKLQLQKENPELFAKIKYFDFILNSDNDRKIGFIGSKYVLLDNNFDILKQLEVNKNNESGYLEIFPFRDGYARTKSNQGLIDQNGDVVPGTLNKKCVHYGNSCFIQTAENEVSLKTVDGNTKETWPGIIWAEYPTHIYHIKVGTHEHSMLVKSSGEVLCDSVKVCSTYGNRQSMFVETSSGQLLVYDSLDNVIFSSDKYVKQGYGTKGFTTVKDGVFGFYDFAARKFTPLSNDKLVPMGNFLVWNEKGAYGFTDYQGKVIYPVGFVPARDFSIDYYSKGDEMYHLVGNQMIKVPVTKAEWEKKISFSNGTDVIRKDNHYYLFSSKTNDFLKPVFDSLYKDPLGNYILTGKSNTAFTVQQHGFYTTFLCRENGKVFLMDSTLTNRISPQMDSLYNRGLEDSKFEINGKWGVLSMDAKVVFDARYDKVMVFSPKHYKVTLNKKTGIINSDQNIILPLEYDEVIAIQNGFMMAKKGNDKFVFDPYGKQVVNHPVETADIKFEDGKLKCYYVDSAGRANVVLTQIR